MSRALSATDVDPATKNSKSRHASPDNAVSRRVLVIGLQVVVGVVFLSLWQLAVSMHWISGFFVSKPSLIWTALKNYVTSADMWVDSKATISETFLGFLGGSASGLVAGLLLARFPLVRAILTPYLTALNALPRVALAPIFILWFGIGAKSKVYLSISIVFFIVMVATEAGIRTVEADYLMMGKSIGARERQIFMKIVLPGSIPGIFSGLRLGSVYSLLAVIMSEMLSAQHGWGEKVSFYSQSFDTSGLFAVLCVVVVFAVLFNGAVSRLERYLLRWQR